MNGVRIKVCGITRIEDAREADALGVDALGFVFVKKSKRFVSLDDAAGIAAAIGPFVQRVGLFLNDEAALVNQALQAMPGLMAQFHGQESAEFCDQFDRPYLKAIGVAGGMPTPEALQAYRHCCGFLFDSNAPGELGGTGHTFDWNTLRDPAVTGSSSAGAGVNTTVAASKHLILAGGLAAHNIVSAIEQVQPYAVDVSTGVEAAPGIKDRALMSEFVRQARSVNLASDE